MRGNEWYITAWDLQSFSPTNLQTGVYALRPEKILAERDCRAVAARRRQDEVHLVGRADRAVPNQQGVADEGPAPRGHLITDVGTYFVNAVEAVRLNVPVLLA